MFGERAVKNSLVVVLHSAGREGERFVDELTEANLVVLSVRAWMRKTTETYPQYQDVAQIHNEQDSEASFSLGLREREG